MTLLALFTLKTFLELDIENLLTLVTLHFEGNHAVLETKLIEVQSDLSPKVRF